jgi:cyclophilin family peptidyl-prolyl cis-trans isomerase
MLTDQDQRVIPAVLTALTRLKAEGVEPLLIERLKAEDFVVRATAATQLGELAPPAAVPSLISAYRFGEVDNTYTARAAALVALSKYQDATAWETIAAALGDKDWALRLRAAELLRQRDPNADVSAMRPAPVSLSSADYQSPDLISPPYSPHAYIETDKGTIQIELAVLDAPLTARNFVALARRGWFNGLAIHRVVPNFVVQDGDPRGDGEGGPGFTIRDELNGRPYLRGTVGMALDWADTGGSQFFITHSPQPHLDARYTVFGHVVAGMEVVDRLDQWDVIRGVRVWDGVTFTGGGPGAVRGH